MLNGLRIVDEGGRDADVRFRAAPHVESVALRADASGDRAWTSGESIEAELTFSEEVTVTEGTPTVSVTVGEQTLTLDYASGSGGKTLVFSRAVGEGERLSGIAVEANSLALGGATIASKSNGTEAALGHAGTEPPDATTPLTATFTGLPEGHKNGNFTFELAFSETLKSTFSYRTLLGSDGASPLSVTNGTLGSVERIVKWGADRNRRWRIGIAPDENADVTIALAAGSACTADTAPCTADGRGLSETVSATVPRGDPDALTVSMGSAAKEHDGETAFVFEVRFSDEPEAGYSFETMRDHTISIVQGEQQITPYVWRLEEGKNRRWGIQVTPASKADVVATVAPKASCEADGAICTAGGRQLSNTATLTILGPVAISVADAEVREGPGATLDFVVTLSRAAPSELTVDYATSDGTAIAGEDYSTTSGTLAFAAGDTSKTIEAPVLEDAIDDDGETVILTLSNVSGGNAYLADATATGTIHNTGAMPQAWLARFGRTVAEQVLDAVEGRIRSAPPAGAQVTLAGQRLAGEAPDAEALEEAEAKARLARVSAWLAGETEAREGRTRSRPVAPRELLTGSSFALTAKADGLGGGVVSLWGRGAVSRFDGREGELSLDGEVTGALLGADWTRERWTAGLMLSHARGEGGYRGASSGEVGSTVTGLYPYGRYALSERVTLWGVAGYGMGELELTPEDGAEFETDIDLAMAAAGLRGVVVEAPEEGGPELAVKTDALGVRTSSEAVRDRGDGGGNLAAATADVTRLRLGLEGAWKGLAIGTGTLTPRLEVGVRHDGGDAETGFGLDLGAGLAWSDPGTGLRAEASGRGLLTHESGGFRQRGFAGSLGWDPAPGSDRGPSLTLTQSMGLAASGGADALLGRRTLAGLAANDDGDELERQRLEVKFDYGFAAFGDRFTATPELGFGLSAGARDYRLGWRLTRAARFGGALELALEGRRRESANDNAKPEDSLGFRITSRW